MQIIKTIFLITLATIFVACTKQVSRDETSATQKINQELELKKEENQIVKKAKEYKFTKNEKDFLEILKNDKYASICNSEDKYYEVTHMEDSKEKSKLLEELFYEYTNNLVNSCIDRESFKNSLKQSKYKKRSQYYELYEVKIDKKSLISNYKSDNKSVESILNKYAPNHPLFFTLIKELDIKKLSYGEYNKLRLNIERLKLLKDYKSDNFIQLNVPSYNFTMYENGKEERSFGTIVGEKESQTPIFSSKLSYFIVNPAWNIPDSIAKDTIIPKALKDKNYLKRKNIVIRKNYKLDSQKFNFKDIKWKKYLKKHVKYIPYKFIQLPSKTNGMGRVKFMFPNDYAVYMHDTIGTWRFKVNKEKIRSVSHGCVRLEHPISFMKHLTKKYTPKTYTSVRKSYLNNEMRTVGLSKKVPVHITYMTAFVKNGKVGFYKDIYEYDKIQKLNFIPYDSALALSSINNKNNIKSF